MKLGIFGDSYSETQKNTWGGDRDYPGWTELLVETYQPELYENHARGGTSAWWSYQKFLEHYKKFDHIIFVHSFRHRWPYLPDEFIGRHGDIGGSHNSMKPFKGINHMLFTDELSTFICKNIAHSIEKHCNEYGITLLHIFVENANEILDDTLKSPAIVNFSHPSFTELVTLKGKTYILADKITGLDTPDFRTCHMSPKNNKIVANLIKKMYNENIKLMDFKNSVYFNMIASDEVTDALYVKYTDKNGKFIGLRL